MLEDIPDTSDNKALHNVAEELAEFRENDWRNLLDLQPYDLQQKLFQATIRVFDDIPNSGANEDTFMAGYLHAAVSITSVSNE